MTQLAARRMAPEDLGDTEPGSWDDPRPGIGDDAPARRGLPEEPSPQFPVTPVRVDESFGVYEPYVPAPELPPFDTVAEPPGATETLGWGAHPVTLQPVPHADYGYFPPAASAPDRAWTDSGLRPYAPEPVAFVPGPCAPQPTAPVPYPGGHVLQQAAVPGDPYALAVPAFDTSATPSAGTGVLAAVGTLFVLGKLVRALPAVFIAVIFTVTAVRFGGMTWLMALVSWGIAATTAFGRRVGPGETQRLARQRMPFLMRRM